MRNFPWIENPNSAWCVVSHAGKIYRLYAGRPAGRGDNVHIVEADERVVGFGIADEIGEAMAKAEQDVENWMSKVWRTY